MGAMAGLFVLEICVQRFGHARLRWVSYVLDGFGLIFSATSLISFLYQGTPGAGVVVYLLLFSAMSVFHAWQHVRIRKGLLEDVD